MSLLRLAWRSRLMKTTQKLTGTQIDETMTHDHVDMQDDLLLEEYESLRQRFSN